MSTIVKRKSETLEIDFDWGTLNWYANADLLNTQEMTVGKCTIKPGCSNPKHMHPNCSEVLVVQQGTIEHTLNDEESVILEEGDTISIEPNFYHNAKNVGDVDAILQIAFSSANRLTVGEDD
ncbi:MAG: cupin domain-containing protein [Lentisphaeria bacterium]|nr:cupin domain-containing protein [Lentisphaeria bacterium]NQZ68025.1 cupin domain-containing protein [Lentisphaeria bacterium]